MWRPPLMGEVMTLIAGRTAKQGAAISSGKLKSAYQKITSTVEMNVEDMARLGFKEGDEVELSTAFGKTVLTCTGRKPQDLPSGLLFLPYGPHSTPLMGSDTAGSGMPISKNLMVTVEPKTKTG
jgi:formylmethanofuran dehydrogenase subunit D